MDGQTGEMKYVRGFDGCGFRTECLYTTIAGRQVIPIFLFFPILFLFFETIPIYSYFGVKIPIFSCFFYFQVQNVFLFE